jgi:phospholipid N-methyltransferase
MQNSQVLFFFRHFLRHPAMVGAVVPGSKFVVKDLVAQIDWREARLLVEFGPGLGTITREVLKLMHPEAVLVGIELNRDFVHYLEDEIRDPRFRVVQGSAVDVRQTLAEMNLGIPDYIISSIPYSNMSLGLRRQILLETREALGAKGVFLVYQYSRALLPHLQSTFGSVRRCFQPLNIFPAHIFHCTP